MKWETTTLIEKVKTLEDELGNNIYENKEILTTKGRFTPWTDEERSIEGRDVTLNEQRVIIPIPYDNLPVFEYIKIKDKLFKVKQKIDLSPRFTMLQIKKYKDG